MPKTKRGEITTAILVGIGVVGIAFIGAALPGIFEIPKLFYKWPKDRYVGRSLERSLARLKRRGLIHFVRGSRGWRLELTSKGHKELRAFEIKEKIIKKPKRWDGKWRMVIFDIEEKNRFRRDQVRKSLVAMGFYRLQDSVWVYPYECEEILELLRTNYGVRYEALYLRTEYLSKDEYLREHFNLK